MTRSGHFVIERSEVILSLQVPLWRQLQAAASVLAAVRRGESATPAIARVGAELRPGAQALAFHVLRHLGRAEALRRLLAQKPPPPAADALLCTALALAWQEEGAPYEPFTLVDQAVEAAKRGRETRPQQAFVNACLRRFLRERAALVQATEADPVARWNHPRWWVARLQSDHPDDWEQVLEVNNTPAPMTLRANTHRISREPLQELLAAQHIASEPVGIQGLILDRPHAVEAIPGFHEGLWSVQDAGAQLAAQLLLGDFAHDAPLRILDACAAPGGKTAHICELARHAQVLALDVDPVRCERIHQNLRRLDLQAEVRAADAGEPAADLAVAGALVSSIGGTALPADCVIFGEISLSGAVRPVSQMEARLKEAEKLGFRRAILPASTVRQKPATGLALTEISDLAGLVAHLAAGSRKGGAGGRTGDL